MRGALFAAAFDLYDIGEFCAPSVLQDISYNCLAAPSEREASVVSDRQVVVLGSIIDFIVICFDIVDRPAGCRLHIDSVG